MQRTSFRRTQSITGSVLVGLGALILGANLDHAINQLSHVLGPIPRQALGMLPAIIVTASQVVQACAADQRGFLHACLWHTLAYSWPVVLVAVGALLSRESYPG